MTKTDQNKNKKTLDDDIITMDFHNTVLTCDSIINRTKSYILPDGIFLAFSGVTLMELPFSYLQVGRPEQCK